MRGLAQSDGHEGAGGDPCWVRALALAGWGQNLRLLLVGLVLTSASSWPALTLWLLVMQVTTAGMPVVLMIRSGCEHGQMLTVC